MTAAVILAGGRATRLGGRDKRELVVDGETIFARQVAVLAPRVTELLVSAREPVPGFRTVHDAVPDGGPLAGVAAALAATRDEWLLVVAGDMPYITGEVVDLLLASRAKDAVGIRVGGLPQPLFCVVRVAAARPVLATLREKRASGLLARLDQAHGVAWLEDAALRTVDPDLRSLHNVNAPEDLVPSPGRIR